MKQHKTRFTDRHLICNECEARADLFLNDIPGHFYYRAKLTFADDFVDYAEIAVDEEDCDNAKIQIAAFKMKAWLP